MGQRTIGTLTSFGSRTFDGTKYVLIAPFTLQGDTSGGGDWVTIDADEYYVAYFAGQVAQRNVDDAGALVDWSGYAAYRATYSVNVSGTVTAYTNEAITFALEVDGDGNAVFFDPVQPDGRILDLAAIDLIAQIVIAGGGAIVLDANGAGIIPGTAYASTRAYRFRRADGTELGGLFGKDVTGTPDSHYVRAAAESVTGENALAVFEAVAPTGNTATAQLQATSGAATAGITIQFKDDLSVALIDIAGAPCSIGELLTNYLDATLASGANNNVDVTGFSEIRITGPGGVFNITGFAGGVDGKLLFVTNRVAHAMTLKYMSTSSTAGNRIATGTGADITCTNALLKYDGESTRWRVVSAQGTGAAD